MPKQRGFNNPNRIETTPLSLSFLEANFKEGEKVTFETLLKKGLLSKKEVSVKILSNGSLKKKLEVEGISVSEGAKKKIEKAGGSVK